MATDFTPYGRYADQMIKGNLFVYPVPAQALLLSATTGLHPTVWNPQGSGMLFIPVRLVMSFVSGTTVIGSVLIAETLNTGSGISATAPIKTFTDVAAIPARMGAGEVSTMRFAPTTCTFVAAPSVISATSINLGAADPTSSGHEHTHEFMGTLAFEPGTAMSVCYSVTTTTALYIISISGLEVPYPVL